MRVRRRRPFQSRQGLSRPAPLRGARPHARARGRDALPRDPALLTASREIVVPDRDAAVEVVRAALADSAPLELRGSGTKRGWGGPVRADRIVQLGAMAGVVRYEPEELVLSVKPGTTVSELDELLARHAQMLAFEPPDFGPLWAESAGRATIGGIV